jgi:hypothetical protein
MALEVDTEQLIIIAQPHWVQRARNTLLSTKTLGRRECQADRLSESGLDCLRHS